ncbi:MAG TPA: hypothetical protein VFU23_03085 [Gemmatimonadales bacterium]|nr:hypothetical protein [Gemmatimonadales bacterium]
MADGIIEIDDFHQLRLDPAKLEYHSRYFKTNYYDELRHGQGTEQILRMIWRHGGPSSRWMDLGAGTSTLFWAIPLSGVSSISCSEVSPEPLAVLRSFSESDEVPACYQQALEMFGRSPAHLAEMKRKLRRYYVFDALSPWHLEERFDLITQLGLFGLAPSAEGYVRALRFACRHLGTGGRIIGANWIVSRPAVERGAVDNSFVTTELVQGAAVACKLRILHCERAAVMNDPDYEAVVMWALELAG